MALRVFAGQAALDNPFLSEYGKYYFVSIIVITLYCLYLAYIFKILIEQASLPMKLVLFQRTGMLGRGLCLKALVLRRWQQFLKDPREWLTGKGCSNFVLIFVDQILFFLYCSYEIVVPNGGEERAETAAQAYPEAEFPKADDGMDMSNF